MGPFQALFNRKPTVRDMEHHVDPNEPAQAILEALELEDE